MILTVTTNTVLIVIVIGFLVGILIGYALGRTSRCEK
jgi:membrane protein DedA with SNARE-associated domain